MPATFVKCLRWQLWYPDLIAVANRLMAAKLIISNYANFSCMQKCLVVRYKIYCIRN